MKSCFVIPVHEPKFGFLAELLESGKKHFGDDLRVIVVFSSEYEREKFSKRHPHLSFHPTVCMPTSGCVITEKKFHGIRYAFEAFSDTDFVACVDSECMFVRNVDVDSLFERWFDRKEIFASYGSDDAVVMINSASAKRLFPLYEDQIKTLTNDYRSYFWFNDIPIYERLSFVRCLDFIDYEHVKRSMRRSDWDFIVYAYYLFLRENFSLKMVEIDGKPVISPYGFLENQGNIDADVLKFSLEQMRPMWIKTYDPSFSNDIFMTFHRDRR